MRFLLGDFDEQLPPLSKREMTESMLFIVCGSPLFFQMHKLLFDPSDLTFERPDLCDRVSSPALCR